MDATVDFVSPPTPALPGNGEGPPPALAVSVGAAPSVPGASPGARHFLARLRESAWAPVAARAGAIVAGMLALGGIGALSTRAGAGVPFSLHAAAPASASAVWVAPDHPGPNMASGVAGPAEGASSAVPASSPPGDAASATSGVSPPEPAAGLTADGKVILNTATVEQLTKLPRVGPKRAQAIVALRAKLGRFRQATDLLRVRGIGRKTLRVMLPLFVIDPPSDTHALVNQNKPGGQK